MSNAKLIDSIRKMQYFDLHIGKIRLSDRRSEAAFRLLVFPTGDLTWHFVLMQLDAYEDQEHGGDQSRRRQQNHGDQAHFQSMRDNAKEQLGGR